MSTTIEICLNGTPERIVVDDGELLLDALRRRLGCTSVREGCGVGMCGACTVLVNGASNSSCLTLAVRADGAEITTAEGLPPGHPVVAAFVAAGALQCGYCIPGFVMMATELLASDPSPDREAITRHIAGNICRCGTYPEILNAIAAAASATASG